MQQQARIAVGQAKEDTYNIGVLSQIEKFY